MAVSPFVRLKLRMLGNGLRGRTSRVLLFLGGILLGLYLGGMGSRERNFYHALATRAGDGPAADEVQRLYLAGRHRDAAAAVPQEFLDRTSLLGPVPRIAQRLRAYADAGVTTLSVMPFAGGPEAGAATLRAVVAAAAQAGLDG